MLLFSLLCCLVLSAVKLIAKFKENIPLLAGCWLDSGRRRNAIFLHSIHFLDSYDVCLTFNRGLPSLVFFHYYYIIAYNERCTLLYSLLLDVFILHAHRVSVLQLHISCFSDLTLMHTTNLVIFRTLKWNLAFSNRNRRRRHSCIH